MDAGQSDGAGKMRVTDAGVNSHASAAEFLPRPHRMPSMTLARV